MILPFFPIAPHGNFYYNSRRQNSTCKRAHLMTPYLKYTVFVGLNIFYYIIQVQESNKFDIQTI